MEGDFARPARADRAARWATRKSLRRASDLLVFASDLRYRTRVVSVLSPRNKPFLVFLPRFRLELLDFRNFFLFPSLFLLLMVFLGIFCVFYEDFCTSFRKDGSFRHQPDEIGKNFRSLCFRNGFFRNLTVKRAVEPIFTEERQFAAVHFGRIIHRSNGRPCLRTHLDRRIFSQRAGCSFTGGNGRLCTRSNGRVNRSRSNGRQSILLPPNEIWAVQMDSPNGPVQVAASGAQGPPTSAAEILASLLTCALVKPQLPFQGEWGPFAELKANKTVALDILSSKCLVGLLVGVVILRLPSFGRGLVVSSGPYTWTNFVRYLANEGLWGVLGSSDLMDPFGLLISEKMSSKGDHQNQNQSEPADADGDDEDEGDGDEDGDGVFGEGEEELSSEDGGGYDKKSNGNSDKKAPGGGAGAGAGEGEENGEGEEEEEGEEEDDDDGEDDEEDEDGEDEEEDVVEEEEEDEENEEEEDEEEDEEEEALQPPKKRKK
ncbi:hypothetical protein ACLOJK_018277 [Asimina triloba]